jgi:hypothetical protein
MEQLKVTKKHLMDQKQMQGEKLSVFRHQMVRLQNLCVRLRFSVDMFLCRSVWTRRFDGGAN